MGLLFNIVLCFLVYLLYLVTLFFCFLCLGDLVNLGVDGYFNIFAGFNVLWCVWCILRILLIILVFWLFCWLLWLFVGFSVILVYFNGLTLICYIWYWLFGCVLVLIVIFVVLYCCPSCLGVLNLDVWCRFWIFVILLKFRLFEFCWVGVGFVILYCLYFAFVFGHFGDLVIDLRFGVGCFV